MGKAGWGFVSPIVRHGEDRRVAVQVIDGCARPGQEAGKSEEDHTERKVRLTYDNMHKV